MVQSFRVPHHSNLLVPVLTTSRAVADQETDADYSLSGEVIEVYTGRPMLEALSSLPGESKARRTANHPLKAACYRGSTVRSK